MKLSIKFILLVLVLLALTMTAGAAVMIGHEQKGFESEIDLRAKTVSSFGTACREYTQKVLSPAVEKRFAKYEVQLAEAAGKPITSEEATKRAKNVVVFEAQSRTFVARGTMKQFNDQEGMKNYLFREASLNPLNEANRATPFEKSLIDRFVADANLKELSGFEQVEGREHYFIAKPILVEKSCLKCHDTVAGAPKDLRDKYPGPGGFGWKENDRNHALIIWVPSDDLRTQQSAAIGKIGGIFGVLGVAVIGLMFGGFHFLVSRRLEHTAEVMKEVARDPATQTRIIDPSTDEIGVMNRSVNTMLDKILPIMKARQEERDAIQGSVRKLLDEVSGVADGDLTKEAEVNADATGALADSFNHMTAQLRKIISNVQGATVQVSSTATNVRSSAEHLAEGSESQAKQILATSTALGRMAGSIQQVSQTASESAAVAEQALQNAKNGAHSVQNTIEGMNRIRDQVQETAKRIKRLGESSQEIGQIIQLIDDIADRTSILALNASIQAAMAGEAGRGFAVVAEEVERLAVRSTEATKKIASLVKTIQSETGEATSAMEKGIKEVVDGSKLANQAGQALAEIETVSSRLAGLIQSISQASKQQARGSEALAKSMGVISEVTQQTALGTKDAAVSVSQLTELADALRESVSAFRLPGGLAGDGKGDANGNSRTPRPASGRSRLPALTSVH